MNFGFSKLSLEKVKGFLKDQWKALVLVVLSPFIYFVLIFYLGLYYSLIESLTVLFFLLSLASFAILFSFLEVDDKRRVVMIECLLFVVFFFYWFFNAALGFALMLFAIFYGIATIAGGGLGFFQEAFHFLRKVDFQSVLSVFNYRDRSVKLGVFEEELNTFKNDKARTEQWKWNDKKGVFKIDFENEVNRHAIVVGSSGFGKSNLLKNLAFKVSGGGVIHVLDSHGEYKSVVKGIVVKAGKVGLNLWDLDGKPVSWRVNENVSVMKGVLNLGDMQAYYLTMAARNAFHAKGFKSGESVEAEEFNEKLKAPSSADVLHEARKLEKLNSSVKTLCRRLEMLSWGNLFPADDSINLSELAGKSVVFDLSGIPSLELKQLFVEVYLRKIYNKAVTRGLKENLTILIDEGESLIFNTDKGDFQSYADRLSAEARKFKVGLIIGTQRCTALSKSLVNNSGVFFSFFIREPNDAKYVAKLLCGNSSDEWKLSVVQEKLNILKRGEFLFVSSVYRDPVLVKGDFFKGQPAVIGEVESVQEKLSEPEEEPELIKPLEVKTGDLLKKELKKVEVEKPKVLVESEGDKLRREKRILTNIRRKGWVSVQEVMQFNEVSKRTAVRDLGSLISQGLIKRKGQTNSTIYVFSGV